MTDSHVVDLFEPAAVGRRVLDALRTEAERCLTCRRAHTLRRAPDTPTWASPDDGHSYRRMYGGELRAWLHGDEALAVAEGAVAAGPVTHPDPIPESEAAR